MSVGTLPPAGRQLVLTVDVEAFDASRHRTLVRGHGGLGSGSRGQPACGSPISSRWSTWRGYEHGIPGRTRSSLAALGPSCRRSAGSIRTTTASSIQSTGDFPGESSGWPQRIAGYRPRASMFYDVVRRQKIDLATWLAVVTAEYERLLRDAALAMPSTCGVPARWMGSRIDRRRDAYVRSALRLADTESTQATLRAPSEIVMAGRDGFRHERLLVSQERSDRARAILVVDLWRTADLPSRTGRAGRVGPPAATLDE